MTRLVFSRDRDGRAVARAAPGDVSDTSTTLADWLTQDVPWADHALHVMTARTMLTGNAYALTPGPDTVVLRHLHRSDQPDVRIPRARMAAELKDWAAFLRPGEAADETG